MAAINLLQYAAQSQSPMAKGIVQKITNEAQFMKLFYFIPVDGFEYIYRRQETLGGIAFRGLNANYTPDIGVINPQVERLSIMGGAVNTDRQIANKPSGDRVRTNAIAQKSRKIGLQYDKYALQGDPAVTPLSFFGLNARLTGKQVISAGTNGGSLTLALLDQAIDQTVGATQVNKVIVCNKYIRRQITALLRPQAIGSTSTQQAASGAGEQVQSYNEVPIVVFDEDGDEQPILAETETQGSSSLTTSLYTMRLGQDTEEEYVQGLLGSQMVDSYSTGFIGTFMQDIVESNFGMAMFHPRAATRLKGLL